MMEDGLFDRFPVQSIYAMHNWPAMKPGTGINPGPMMAAADRITIEITWPWRPWCTRLPDGGRGAGGSPHHHSGAEHRLAQRAPD